MATCLEPRREYVEAYEQARRAFAEASPELLLRAIQGLDRVAAWPPGPVTGTTFPDAARQAAAEGRAVLARWQAFSWPDWGPAEPLDAQAVAMWSSAAATLLWFGVAILVPVAKSSTAPFWLGSAAIVATNAPMAAEVVNAWAAGDPGATAGFLLLGVALSGPWLLLSWAARRLGWQAPAAALAMGAALDHQGRAFARFARSVWERRRRRRQVRTD